MAQEYKGYSFDVLIKPVAGNNRWTFTTVVHIPQGARDRVTELNSTQDFASEAEAGMEAIAFVKKSIDEGEVSL
jgi:hypothetical protein